VTAPERSVPGALALGLVFEPGRCMVLVLRFVSSFLSATGGEADFFLATLVWLARTEGKGRATRAEGCKPGHRDEETQPDRADRDEQNADAGDGRRERETGTRTAATTG